MIIFKYPGDIHSFLSGKKNQGIAAGFVPTMGALHDGHLSIIQQSLIENALTVCSIFVNPTQFNDPKDFEKYPSTIEKDICLLEKAGCDVLFLPAVADIYPNGPSPGSRIIWVTSKPSWKENTGLDISRACAR